MNESMLYTKTNEYLLENDDCFLVGMTDYALENLGDIIFIELPEVGNKFKKNEAFATIESIKKASEIYMPISGVVVEINENIVNNPHFLNDETFNDKWLIKINKIAIKITLPFSFIFLLFIIISPSSNLILPYYHE